MAAGLMHRPLRLGPFQLANRVVALPVFSGYAYPDGRVSPQLLSHYERLARSGVGLVMVANTAVDPAGMTSPRSLRIDHDRFVPGLTRLVRAIHAGGARAGLQLNHAGRLAWSERPLGPASLTSAHLGFNIAALKDFMQFFPLERRFALTRRFLRQAGAWRQAMSADDCRQVAVAFGDAALRAVAAGFDVIELHGASGYLLSQFLSAFTNPPPQRDAGDDLVRRMAFPLSVLARVRRCLPADVPVGWRLMLHEFVPDGVVADQATVLARRLETAGAAYLSVSAGTFNSLFAQEVRRHTARPGHLGPDCARLRQAVHLPVVAAGRILTPVLAERLLADGAADLVGLGRPLRADAKWLIKARQHRPVRCCVDCGWCLRRVALDQGFACSRWSRRRLARTDLAWLLAARSQRWLWIVEAAADLGRYRDRAVLLPVAPLEDPGASRADVLFLPPRAGADPDPDARRAFLGWVGECFGSATVLAPLATGTDGPAGAAQDLLRRRPYAGVVLCRRDDEPWRQRLLYRPRGKVTVLLGAEAEASKVLVPVDLSETSRLQLALVQHLLLSRPGVRVTVVHVLDRDDRGRAGRAWANLRRVVRWPAEPALRTVPAGGDIAGDLLALVRGEGYGTVVMGKRGLSGVKRLLLGSVSATVVRQLPDRTVFLVD